MKSQGPSQEDVYLERLIFQDVYSMVALPFSLFLSLQDSIVHGVLVLGLFAGAVALASYVPGAKDQTGIPTFGGTFRRIVSAAEAACVS